MNKEEYNKFLKLVYKQLSKYPIKFTEYYDYAHIVYLYIHNRKGKVDIKDKYIYGDIKNAIANQLRLDIRYKKNVFLTDTTLYHDYHSVDKDLNLITSLISDYEFGQLFIDKHFNGYSVVELCKMYGMSRSTIYRRLNEIKSELDWVV